MTTRSTLPSGMRRMTSSVSPQMMRLKNSERRSRGDSGSPFPAPEEETAFSLEAAALSAASLFFALSSVLSSASTSTQIDVEYVFNASFAHG